MFEPVALLCACPAVLQKAQDRAGGWQVHADHPAWRGRGLHHSPGHDLREREGQQVMQANTR